MEKPKDRTSESQSDFFSTAFKDPKTSTPVLHDSNTPLLYFYGQSHLSLPTHR
jgi:hypothetical protein